MIGLYVEFTLRVPLEIIVCYFHTYENNLGIKQKFTKYLKENCCLASDQHFSFKYFPKNASVWKVLSKIVRPVLATLSVNGLKPHPVRILVFFTYYATTQAFNPLTLRAAERGLIVLDMLYLQMHFIENIWRRNVYQKPNNNSLSNNLWTFALFKSYFLKYKRSRRYLLEKLEC